MIVHVDEATYATLAQDLADCEGAPAVFTFGAVEEWYLPCPLLGSPVLLLNVVESLVKSGLLRQLPDAAGELSEGRRVSVSGIWECYPCGATLCMVRTFPSAGSANLLATLLLDSFVMRLLSELSGLPPGIETVLFPCTSEKFLCQKLPPRIEHDISPLTGDCSCAVHSEQPDLGPVLGIVARGDKGGAEVIADLTELVASPKITTRSRFARRVVAPLYRYRETRDAQFADSIRDPYVRESLLIHHRRVH